MTTFHITKSGEPAKCSATTKACPLGGQHFTSQREAMESLNEPNPVRGRLAEELRELSFMGDLAEWSPSDFITADLEDVKRWLEGVAADRIPSEGPAYQPHMETLRHFRNAYYQSSNNGNWPDLEEVQHLEQALLADQGPFKEQDRDEISASLYYVHPDRLAEWEANVDADGDQYGDEPDVDWQAFDDLAKYVAAYVKYHEDRL